MAIAITRKSEQDHAAIARTAIPGAALAAALLVLAASMGGPRLAAQSPAAPAASAAPAAHTHRRPSPSRLMPPAIPVAEDPPPATPPAPELPHWPVNDQPAEAAVTWDSQGLRVEAANSSLEQILKDISTATGAKVEGLSGDQRVFGMYGPGQARDVLSQLLLGSGYNVIMIGDQGQGAPRQILLSARNAGDAQGAANKNGGANGGEEEAPENDADEQPQQPIYQPPMRPGMGPGGPPRTPQQIMQEMQQRQQQMQQMQQRNPQ